MVTRIGGICLLAALGVWLVADAVLQGSWSIGGFGPDAVGPTIALLLIGVGATLIALGDREPFDRRAMRLGLGLLAVGGLALFGASIRAGMLSFDPLEDALAVSLLLGGVVAIAGGLTVTGLSMLARRGLDAVIGALLLGGLIADVLTSVVGPDVALGGFLLILLGLAGIGLRAVNAPGLTPPTPAPPPGSRTAPS